jgi:uncharacterized membrane protein HdeD (DUF308 family)
VTESAGNPIDGVVDALFWRPMLWRSLVLLVLAAVVTFSSDHSITFGWIVFGILVLATTITVQLGIRFVSDESTRRILRLLMVLSAGFSVIAIYNLNVGSSALILTMLIWAAATGIIELIAGLRLRGRDPISREWVATGIITMIFAVALLVVPADYSLTYEVPVKGGEPLTLTLDATVIAVGLLGAYAVLLGVYLLIAAISLRPARAVLEVTP